MSRNIKPFITRKDDRRAPAFRRAIGNTLIILSISFTIYIAAVMLYKISAVELKQSYIIALGAELVICALSIAFSFDVRTGFLTIARNSFLKFIGWVLRIIVTAVAVIVIALDGYIVVNGFGEADPKADNAVVLGMALENGEPNADLISRVETAVRYAEKNPGASIIAAGGNGGENVRSEAEVIKDLLIERGVSPSRIITEDKSADTVENFRNTAALIGTDGPIVIITSSYHIQRAVDIAKSAGFTDVHKYPAAADPLFYSANVTWEVITTINRLIFNK